MNHSTSAREYVRRFQACVSCCSAIPIEDRTNVPAKPIRPRDLWLIARGTDGAKTLIEEDPAASSPFELIHGGRLALEVRV